MAITTYLFPDIKKIETHKSLVSDRAFQYLPIGLLQRQVLLLKGIEMKSIMQNTVTFFDQQFFPDLLTSSVDPCALLVAGYSRLNDPSWERKPGVNRNVATAFLCATIARDEPLSREQDIEADGHLLDARDKFKSCIGVLQGKAIFINGQTVFAKFNDVDSALLCAANVQIALSKQNACLKPAQQVRYRISISVCEADAHQGKPSYRTVNLAPDFESVITTSGIFVSQLARESLVDKDRIRFVSLGKRFLPDCKDPVESLWIELDSSMVFETDEDENDQAFAKVS